MQALLQLQKKPFLQAGNQTSQKTGKQAKKETKSLDAAEPI